MNTEKTLKTLYKQNLSLELKNKILNFLINKVAIVTTNELDLTFETLLNNNKIFPNRYARGYYAAFYEI